MDRYVEVSDWIMVPTLLRSGPCWKRPRYIGRYLGTAAEGDGDPIDYSVAIYPVILVEKLEGKDKGEIEAIDYDCVKFVT